MVSCPPADHLNSAPATSSQNLRPLARHLARIGTRTVFPFFGVANSQLRSFSHDPGELNLPFFALIADVSAEPADATPESGSEPIDFPRR